MGKTKTMAASTLIALLQLSLLLSSAVASERLSSRAQQCQLDRIPSLQPSDPLEFEGGMIEMWDENEQCFQCAGVAARRFTVQPNSLSLPNFQPSPSLIYVEQGEGVIGITFPGCPETFHSIQEEEEYYDMEEEEEDEMSRSRRRRRPFREEEEEEQQQGRRMRDIPDVHQKVHRIRRGDIIAIPVGAVHWIYNDCNKNELRFVKVNDLNNDANQLDNTYRSIYLAGSMSSQRGGERGQMDVQHILSGFNPELLAEVFGTRDKVIRQMIQTDYNRGFIVRAGEEMQSLTKPVMEDMRERGYSREFEEEIRPRRSIRRSRYQERDEAAADNGMEETFCSMDYKFNIDTRRDADVMSKEAGVIQTVNEHKLPMLKYIDMAAEKGHITPNSIYSPHWSINGHSIVYVTRGEAHMQIVGCDGTTLMDDRVQEGDMFVIPQFFVSTCRAGRDGFEYVSFKTSGSPMRSTLVGASSVMRALPVQVIAAGYDMDVRVAKQIKMRTGQQQCLVSPLSRRMMDGIDEE